MEKLAIKGGRPVRTKPFPSWPVFGEEERRRLLAVFDSGQWWYGERVKEFEQKFAAFQDAKYGVTCTNGTAALELGLLALGVGAGDEVIVPPYSFIATANSVLRVNATPVFADIQLDTCNLDPAETEKKITRKTKAIIPVHFGGLPVDMDAFRKIVRKHNLFIIEDACHSWGSKWKGKGTGALGDCGAFSFQMSKNITAGEGGILLSDNEKVADTARSYSHCGRLKGSSWYEHALPGGNMRMTEFQAAILLGQLTRLEKQTLKMEANARILDRELKDIPGLGLMRRDKRVTRQGYHMYILRFLAEHWGGVTRERFMEALQAEGIPTLAGYSTPIYANPLFKKRKEKARCPNSERICRESVWIFHPVLLGGENDMLDIARAIEKVWENREQLRG